MKLVPADLYASAVRLPQILSDARPVVFVTTERTDSDRSRIDNRFDKGSGDGMRLTLTRTAVSPTTALTLQH